MAGLFPLRLLHGLDEVLGRRVAELDGSPEVARTALRRAAMYGDWRQVVLLGFIGGTLSGFIGSGGAFFMTPGMMNLGVDGVISVASNITHKFGKAMVGSRSHGAAGNVDRRLAGFLLATAIAGIQLAVWINVHLFKGSGDSHGAGGSAGANLYISLVFVLILSVVAVSMLRDSIKSSANGDDTSGPSRRISDFLSRLNLPPVIYFRVADVKVSVWVLMLVGVATGYLAGTIGVGGFIGVPAMIYIFGVPTAVAAGTELYLAMFMGAYGALSYAYQGMLDIRLTLLLYMGSLVGIHLGVYGVKVVTVRTANRKGKQRRIRFRMGKTPDWKKAMVTLAEGETIDVL